MRNEDEHPGVTAIERLDKLQKLFRVLVAMGTLTIAITLAMCGIKAVMLAGGLACAICIVGIELGESRKREALLADERADRWDRTRELLDVYSALTLLIHRSTTDDSPNADQRHLRWRIASMILWELQGRWKTSPNDPACMTFFNGCDPFPWKDIAHEISEGRTAFPLSPPIAAFLAFAKRPSAWSEDAKERWRVHLGKRPHGYPAGLYMP